MELQCHAAFVTLDLLCFRQSPLFVLAENKARLTPQLPRFEFLLLRFGKLFALSRPFGDLPFPIPMLRDKDADLKLESVPNPLWQNKTGFCVMQRLKAPVVTSLICLSCTGNTFDVLSVQSNNYIYIYINCESWEEQNLQAR